MTSITFQAGSLEALSGTLEENLRYVAERLRVKLSARGDEVSLDGDEAAVALAGNFAAGAGSPPVHWRPYSQGLPSYAMVVAVASQPPGGDVVYAGTYEPPGLWRSADRGASWTWSGASSRWHTRPTALATASSTWRTWRTTRWAKLSLPCAPAPMPR